MKVLSKLNILLFALLISSIIAKRPYNHPNQTHKNPNQNHKNPNQRHNNVTTYEHKRNRYESNDAYQHHHHNKHFKNGRYNNGCSLVLGPSLLSLWFALLILYFLINRRKKTFSVMIRSQENNFSNNYINV